MDGCPVVVGRPVEEREAYSEEAVVIGASEQRPSAAQSSPLDRVAVWRVDVRDVEEHEEGRFGFPEDRGAVQDSENHARLVESARKISWISIVLSLFIGSVCVSLALLWASVSLLALGLETYIDLLSSVAVLWRFYSSSSPEPCSMSSSTEGPRGCVVSASSSAKRKRKTAQPSKLANLCCAPSRGTASPRSQPPIGAATDRFVFKPAQDDHSSQDTSAGSPNDGSATAEFIDVLSYGGTSPSSAGGNYEDAAAVEASANAGTEYVRTDVYTSGTEVKQEAGPQRPSLPSFVNRRIIRSTSPSTSQTAEDVMSMRERRASLAVGMLFLVLGVFVFADAAFNLAFNVTNKLITYRTATVVCAVSWPSAFLVGILIVWKFHLATALQSQVIRKDALCSCFGVCLSIISGTASTVELLQEESGKDPDGVNLDSAAALIISALILIEGIRTIAHNIVLRTK